MANVRKKKILPVEIKKPELYRDKLINYFKNIFNSDKKKEVKKVFCKNCVYYITKMNNPNSVSEHICGHYLETELDAIGNVVFKKYGHIEQCPSCKSILQDDTRVITRSCLEINRNNKCQLYKEKKSIIILMKKIFRRV